MPGFDFYRLRWYNRFRYGGIVMTNKDLYDSQVEMLKTFYERDLLTREQYEYELNVLKTKMHLDD